jgi:hypothetical protein
MMAEKSDIVPTKPFSWQAGEQDGGPVVKWNWSVPFNIYREWATKPTDQLGDLGAKVALPWFLSATILDEADKSDPENQLRVYVLKIGETLAYRVVIAAGLVANEDVPRMALLAAMMIGAEHGAEIRDAIAAERAKTAD